jgi:hypothetical protein
VSTARYGLGVSPFLQATKRSRGKAPLCSQTSAIEGGEVSAPHPGRFLPRERPGTHCTGGWVDPRAGLGRCGKSRPTGIRSPDRPARSQSLYRLSYPAHVTDWTKYNTGQFSSEKFYESYMFHTSVYELSMRYTES